MAERKLGQRKRGLDVDLKAFVATPAYDGMLTTDYTISLGDTCLAAPNYDHAENGPHPKIGVHLGVMANGAFIELCRNQFVTIFLDTDCTHLFFIDSDLRWEPRAFMGLVEACTDEMPVVAGAYRRRQEKEDYPLTYWETPDRPGITLDHGGYIRCTRVATGFLCIKRSIIEEMASRAKIYHIPGWGYAPKLFYTQDVPMALKPNAPVNTDPKPTWASQEQWDNMCLYMGEDIAWCDDYIRQYPGKYIHLWPDFDFVHGGYPCNYHKFIEQELKKQDEMLAAKAAEEEAALVEQETVLAEVANGN